MKSKDIHRKFNEYTTFSTAKRIDGMAPETVTFIRLYLNKYIESLEDVPSRQSLMSYLAQRTSLHPSTKANIASSIGKFLYYSEYITEKDFDIIKRSFRMPRIAWSTCVVTEEMAAAYISLAKNQNRELSRYRNPAIFALFASIGLRISQLTGLNIEDVTLNGDSWRISILRKKENRVSGIEEKSDKYIPCNFKIGKHNAGKTIKRYVDYRDNKSNPFFISLNGKRMTTNAIQLMVSRYSDKLGYQNVTPHKFRHYVGNRVAKKHGIYACAALLDHVDINTTQKYCNPDTIDLKEVMI